MTEDVQNDWQDHIGYLTAYVDDFMNEHAITEEVEFLDSLIEELTELRKQYKALDKE